MFPRIEHLDQVREAISGKPEFIVAERDWGYVVNYVVQTPETFSHVDSTKQSILRECRGIKFNRAGTIVSRPFHKFFNVNEREESLLSNIDQGRSVEIMPKLDGSMITPVRVNRDEIVMMTKMGYTDVGKQATEFALRDHHFVRMFEYLDECSWYLTPIFEWTSRKQKIVVDYPEDRLTLLAIRDTLSGEYHSRSKIEAMSVAFDIPVVGFLERKSLEELIESNETDVGHEGYVVRYDHQDTYKLKTQWYLKLHNVKEQIGLEKNVLRMIVDETIDDAMQDMSKEDKARVERFEREVALGIVSTERSILTLLDEWKSKSKKDFALGYDGPLKSLVFKCWDGDASDVVSEIKNIVLSNTTSSSRVDSIRHLIGGARYVCEDNEF